MHGMGTIRVTAEGTFMAEFSVKGKKTRRTFKKRAHAQSWLEVVRIEAQSRKRVLTASESEDARNALALLPSNVSLADAARAYLSRHVVSDKTVQDAADDYIQTKIDRELRPRSIKDVRGRLSNLAVDFPDTPVSSIETNDLIEWLNDRHYKGASRDNYRRVFVGFFNWCKKEKFISESPAANIPAVCKDETLPGILPVQDVQAFFGSIEDVDPNLCAYFALGFFAGIRPAELIRLDWTAVNGELIHVGPSVAKVRRQRLVDISDNLSKWIDKYRKKSGPVAPSTDEKRLQVWRQKVMAEAGLTVWPHDAARHCFATYHVALHNDTKRTAIQLGHSGLDMLFRHYCNVVTQGDAKTYFQIVPK